MFSNKKIFILGMARSGYEAAKVLAKRNNEILITDMKDQDEAHLKELKALGVKFVKSGTPTELLDSSFDYVIKNPGIKIDHPVVLKAKELGIVVTNEVEVAYNLFPKGIKIIGITGSNGKTTTTTMIYEILKISGFQVYLGGNIGYPVCSLVDLVKNGDILVLEISSHQLHDIIDFKTDISVMTNLSKVHLDHFGDYEYYKMQKFKIFNRHSSIDIAILNKENSCVMKGIDYINSNKIYFSSERNSDAFIIDDAIYYNNEMVIRLDEILVKGKHNYENAMAAISVAKILGVRNDTIKEFFKDFKGVEHRIEFVREVNGVKFYNDSKATNTDSTIVALSSFNDNTILLLGGLDRGHSFDVLKEYMKSVKAVIAYGETKQRIKEFCEKNNFEVYVFDTLGESVKKAYELSERGDVILLSPACASWDQYESFEKRGEEFKKIVGLL